MRLNLVALCLSLLVACQPLSPTLQTDVRDESFLLVTTPTVSTMTSNVIVNNKRLSVTSSSRWQNITTLDGVILAEGDTSLASIRQTDGITIHVFLPPTTDFEIPELDTFAAHRVLSYVVQQPHYVQNARVTTPVAFNWGDYPAAYYTVNGGGENSQVVIAVVVDKDAMVVLNVNVPDNDITDLHARLKDGLHSVGIDERILYGVDLVDLPKELDFPAENIEIASDTTPTLP